ncbi:MAG: response regulator [Calditrichaeota bacterium]|nr:MAG: response regulator [Calditrichota bacterium]
MPSTALVIDDEVALQEIICEVLRHMEIESVAVGSGEQAIETCKENPNRFSVIFLDMNLTGIDGEETYRRISALLPDVPVVFMSGYDVSGEIKALNPSAPHAFLKKPFTMKDLMETARAIIG